MLLNTNLNFSIEVFQIIILTVVFLSILMIIVLQRNLIIFLLLVELVFLATSLNFAVSGLIFFDVSGQLFALSLLAVSAAELVIVLSIIVLYYRLFEH